MRLNSEEDLQVQLEAWLTEYGGANVCLAELLCDRHAKEPGRIALRYEDASGRQAQYAFAELRNLSARFAGVLHNLGVSEGDRVAILLPRTPELMIASLGLWRLGAVHVPLFTAFGPEAVGYRVSHSAACVVVTNAANRSKVQPSSTTLGSGGKKSFEVVVVEDSGSTAEPPGDTPFWASLEKAQPVQETGAFTGSDPFVIIYTSGTTGPPKGAIYTIRLLAAVEAYMHFGLNIREDDVFWNMAGSWLGLRLRICTPRAPAHRAPDDFRECAV